MTDELYRTAIHEAGHAVLAHLLSIKPTTVTIKPDEGRLGHSTLVGECVTSFGAWRGLIVLCGGYLAADKAGHVPEEDPNADSYDILGRDYECYLGDSAISDSAIMWAMFRERSDEEWEQSEWFDRAYGQADEMLTNPDVWRAVETLARRLMEKGAVDGDEASDVINAALGSSEWRGEPYGLMVRHATPMDSWFDSDEDRATFKVMAAAMAGGATP